jgi:hypothetical protein
MAEGKEVAKKGTEALALPDDVLAEMQAASNEIREKLDLSQDVRLPQLRLVQATTQDIEAAAGTIFDTFGSTAHDEVQIVPVTTWKTRAYFGTGTIGDPPVCTSPDAVTGYGTPGGDCTRCPHANWQQGGRCQLRYNYMVVLLGEGMDPENELPRGVMMHGTSAKIASRLNTLLLGSKFVWSNVLTLSSTTEKNDRGQYKVWSVKKERDATPEEQVLAFRWHKTLAKAESVTVADDAAAPAPAEDPDADIPF